MNNPFAEIEVRLSNIENLILDLKHQPKQVSTDQTEQLLTIQQASEFLNLSVPTLYGYVHRSAIPVMKKSKRLYFSKQELIEWVKAGRKKTVSEIEAETDQYLRKKKGENNGTN